MGLVQEYSIVTHKKANWRAQDQDFFCPDLWFECLHIDSLFFPLFRWCIYLFIFKEKQMLIFWASWLVIYFIESSAARLHLVTLADTMSELLYVPQDKPKASVNFIMCRALYAVLHSFPQATQTFPNVFPETAHSWITWCQPRELTGSNYSDSSKFLIFKAHCYVFPY